MQLKINLRRHPWQVPYEKGRYHLSGLFSKGFCGIPTLSGMIALLMLSASGLSQPSISDSAFPFLKNGKWGLKDTRQNIVVSAMYDSIHYYKEERSGFAFLNGNRYYINTQGQVLQDISGFNGQPASIGWGQGRIPEIILPIPKNEMVGILSQTGRCPPNLDFEMGNFTNWTAFNGGTSSPNTINQVVVSQSPPTLERHTLYNTQTNQTDPYGNFPISPPNGSRYAVKLGNDKVGAQAERIRYVVHVPDNDPDFSITFQYAVVLENPDAQTTGVVHEEWQQPRLTAKLYDPLTNEYLPCGSFTYVASLVGVLPGFFQSTVLGGPFSTPKGARIWYKPWSSVYINLSRYQGRTLFLDFTTADCTLGGHFGYAYVDVAECGIGITTDYNCNNQSAILTAPDGFRTYTWYDSTFSRVLGNGRFLSLNPAPPIGSSYQVRVEPFMNIDCSTCDCSDTLRGRLYINYPEADAGPDAAMCSGANAPLGVAGNPAYAYSWHPAAGLSDPTVSNPVTTTNADRQYTLTVTNTRTGCQNTDSVSIAVLQVPKADFTIRQDVQCLKHNFFQFTNQTTPDGPGFTYAWQFGEGTLSRQEHPAFSYPQAGSYPVTLVATNLLGCSDTVQAPVHIRASPDVALSIPLSGQCLTGNQFHFSNASPTPPGTRFEWHLGDGTLAHDIHTTHSYTEAGPYLVELLATTAEGCRDTVSQIITVYAEPLVQLSSNKPLAFCADDSAFLRASASPGSGSLSAIRWYRDNILLFGESDTLLTVRQPGQYRVQVSNSNGCRATGQLPVIIYPTPQVTLWPPVHSLICPDAPTPLRAAGGIAYRWWYNGQTINGMTDSFLLATLPGNYRVEAVSADGCISASSFGVYLTSFRPPIADFTFRENCIFTPITFTNASVVDSAGPLTYRWAFDRIPIIDVQHPVFSFTTTGQFPVTLTVQSTVCPTVADSVTKMIAITEPLPNLRYPTRNAVLQQNLTLQARTPATDYLWSPANGLNNPRISMPVFRFDREMEYTIRLRHENGCINVDTQLVRIFGAADIFVPNAFTPNNDGYNDKMYPILVGMMELRFFRIFNRWGQMVWETRDAATGWNGNFAGQPQPMDTYTWTVEAQDYTGKIIRKNGNLVLIR